MKKYCFDIDGTICTTDCHYDDARPYKNVIKKINSLYDEGNHIIFLLQEAINLEKIGKNLQLISC